MSRTPVALIGFNRPEHTFQTFQAIRQYAPSQLFLILDGPRAGSSSDRRHCDEVRRIVDNVDWLCEVTPIYSKFNLGCRRRVITGLDEVFGAVEQAIVLEDDCLPHADFFRFAERLLVDYADDERVSVISGSNFHDGTRYGDGAYYFSIYNHCWGWATWRRAWQLNNPDIDFWPRWRASAEWRSFFAKRYIRKYWERIFDRMYRSEIDSWAYTWTASIWFQGGLTATPNVNLVSNIGFDEHGTHTVSSRSPLANRPVGELGNILPPSRVEANRHADFMAHWLAFRGRPPGLKSRLQSKCRKWIGRV